MGHSTPFTRTATRVQSSGDGGKDCASSTSSWPPWVSKRLASNSACENTSAKTVLVAGLAPGCSNPDSSSTGSPNSKGRYRVSRPKPPCTTLRYPTVRSPMSAMVMRSCSGVTDSHSISTSSCGAGDEELAQKTLGADENDEPKICMTLAAPTSSGSSCSITGVAALPAQLHVHLDVLAEAHGGEDILRVVEGEHVDAVLLASQRRRHRQAVEVHDGVAFARARKVAAGDGDGVASRVRARRDLGCRRHAGNPRRRVAHGRGGQHGYLVVHHSHPAKVGADAFDAVAVDGLVVDHVTVGGGVHATVGAVRDQHVERLSVVLFCLGCRGPKVVPAQAEAAAAVDRQGVLVDAGIDRRDEQRDARERGVVGGDVAVAGDVEHGAVVVAVGHFFDAVPRRRTKVAAQHLHHLPAVGLSVDGAEALVGRHDGRCVRRQGREGIRHLAADLHLPRVIKARAGRRHALDLRVCGRHAAADGSERGDAGPAIGHPDLVAVDHHALAAFRSRAEGARSAHQGNDGDAVAGGLRRRHAALPRDRDLPRVVHVEARDGGANDLCVGRAHEAARRYVAGAVGDAQTAAVAKRQRRGDVGDDGLAVADGGVVDGQLVVHLKPQDEVGAHAGRRRTRDFRVGHRDGANGHVVVGAAGAVAHAHRVAQRRRAEVLARHRQRFATGRVEAEQVRRRRCDAADDRRIVRQSRVGAGTRRRRALTRLVGVRHRDGRDGLQVHSNAVGRLAGDGVVIRQAGYRRGVPSAVLCGEGLAHRVHAIHHGDRNRRLGDASLRHAERSGTQAGAGDQEELSAGGREDGVRHAGGSSQRSVQLVNAGDEAVVGIGDAHGYRNESRAATGAEIVNHLQRQLVLRASLKVRGVDEIEAASVGVDGEEAEVAAAHVADVVAQAAVLAARIHRHATAVEVGVSGDDVAQDRRAHAFRHAEGLVRLDGRRLRAVDDVEGEAPRHVDAARAPGHVVEILILQLEIDALTGVQRDGRRGRVDGKHVVRNRIPGAIRHVHRRVRRRSVRSVFVDRHVGRHAHWAAGDVLGHIPRLVLVHRRLVHVGDGHAHLAGRRQTLQVLLRRQDEQRVPIDGIKVQRLARRAAERGEAGRDALVLIALRTLLAAGDAASAGGAAAVEVTRAARWTRRVAAGGRQARGLRHHEIVAGDGEDVVEVARLDLERQGRQIIRVVDAVPAVDQLEHHRARGLVLRDGRAELWPALGRIVDVRELHGDRGRVTLAAALADVSLNEAVGGVHDERGEGRGARRDTSPALVGLPRVRRNGHLQLAAGAEREGARIGVGEAAVLDLVGQLSPAGAHRVLVRAADVADESIHRGVLRHEAGLRRQAGLVVPVGNVDGDEGLVLEIRRVGHFHEQAEGGQRAFKVKRLRANQHVDDAIGIRRAERERLSVVVIARQESDGTEVRVVEVQGHLRKYGVSRVGILRNVAADGVRQRWGFRQVFHVDGDDCRVGLSRVVRDTNRVGVLVAHFVAQRGATEEDLSRGTVNSEGVAHVAAAIRNRVQEGCEKVLIRDEVAQRVVVGPDEVEDKRLRRVLRNGPHQVLHHGGVVVVKEMHLVCGVHRRPILVGDAHD
eukprot:scaffold91_cov254-Pinguiococcus_pyrenoidosus.AAC.36